MNAEERAKILERIRKLMALAERAGTEEEADAANRAVHALLSRYNLDISEVPDEQEDGVIEEDGTIERYNESWRRTIMHGCAALYFCKYYYTDAYVKGVNSQRVQKGIKHCFVGRPHNVAVAKMMGQYLVGTVNRLANEAARKELVEKLGGRNPSSTERGRFVNSFRLAAAGRLYSRLLQMKAKAMEGQTVDEEGRNLPALRSLYESEEQAIKDWLDAKALKLVTRKSRASYGDKLGAVAGAKAGDNIGLNTQIGKTGNKSLPGVNHMISDQRGKK
jgi:hypothetical protein